MRAEITGDVESAIEEHDALKSDIEWVSLVCTAAVLLIITLYYRSVVALIYIFFPTLLGVATAFAIAALTIGYLNTNTAFLGSIILGNGINFGIILLARYREQRGRHAEETVEEALAVALCDDRQADAHRGDGGRDRLRQPGADQLPRVPAVRAGGRRGDDPLLALHLQLLPGAHLSVGADWQAQAPAGGQAAAPAAAGRDDHRQRAGAAGGDRRALTCWPPGR